MADSRGQNERIEKDELQKPMKVNGRYVDPWGTTNFPSKTDVFRWMFKEKNERGIGGGLKDLYRFKTQELERTLPILTPDSKALSSPPTDAIQVTWLGHATVLVQMDNVNILTDPNLNTYAGPSKSLSMKRYRPPPCTVEELPTIHAVCVSHDHYDHLDVKSVMALNQRFGKDLCWFVPNGLKNWMSECGCQNIIELEWWEEAELPEKSQIFPKFIFTPSQHWCRRSLTDRNKVLWGSWTIIGARHRFFFAGDTGYCRGFKQIGMKYGPFDFAAIPIGAYKPSDLNGRSLERCLNEVVFINSRWFLRFQHVDPSEAVCIHEDLQSRYSLGIHWGTFPTGKEHYLDPPKDLKEALKSKRIPDSRFFTLKHGETKVIK